MDITRQSLADPLPLASRLIACPSITPATGAVFTVLEEALVALGFEVDRFVSGDAPDGPVENLLALRHQGEGAHFAFAGHLDVVPPGNGWRSEERRVGKEWVSTCRSRGTAAH